ncbi:substrate-binding periplasmic protein [Thalassotalea ganghwensis]
MQKITLSKRTLTCVSTWLLASYYSTPLLALEPSSTIKETLSVAAIDWCPQICPKDNEYNGYIVDLLKKIYPNNEFDIQINYLPWSRAIKYTREGDADVILSPAKAEAPDLVYPIEPIGIQTMCFFTLPKSTWQYNGVDSLANLTIGIAQDTSIEELNSYVENNKHQFQFQPYLDRYVEQNVGKLVRGRIDTFLFTKNTISFLQNQNSDMPALKNAGCVSTANIYIAFSPKIAPDKREKLVKHHDEKLSQMYKNGEVINVLRKYGLSL